MYKILRHVFALQVLLGLAIALPILGHAASVSDQISLNTDDADQDGIGATAQLFSSPHALGQDRFNGYRFTGHGLPDDAFILNASIQFTTENGNSSGSPSTRIVGEDANNAVTFAEQSNNISNRSTTSASVIWNIPAWPTDGESGPAQQTPDLSAIIQEIVDRGGWTSGNPLVLILEPNGGNDTRNAQAFDGSPGDAATLSITYTLCPGGVVTSTADSGAGSLRECINYVNDGLGSTITFNIPGPGNRNTGGDRWWGITPLSPLPTITSAATIIDGTTQTTNQSDTNTRGPEVEIDGAGTGAGANGLVIGATAGGSTIRGLAIGNFSDNGILLLGAGNLIAGNYLGLSADGDALAPNNPGATDYLGGIRVESAANTIGGTTVADRNVISGNGFAGIEINGAGATGNQVYGNYIGTDANGTVNRGNTDDGVDIQLANSNIIGGPAAGQRNILSGNGSDGIDINGGDFNVVQGNYIGTDATGTLTIGNARDGIDIQDASGDGAIGTMIGGAGPNEGNLIYGNLIRGVHIKGGPTTDNSVLGNRIFGSTQLDIDLSSDGITVNDPLDADAGSNDLLNYPEIVAATEVGAIVTTYFNLDVPAGDYRIEFFTNPSGANPSGNGGGEVFAGATTLTHGGAGIQYFVHSFAGSAGDVITATATEQLAGPTYRATSEFSAAFTATVVTPYSGRWPLDESSGVTAIDVDAGNDGTYQNGVLLDQEQACLASLRSVYFDGVDDFVEVPHSPDYLMGEGTVAMWMKIDAIGVQQAFFSKDSTGFDTGGHLTLSVLPLGEVQAQLQSASASMNVTSPPITPGNWVHVAFTWGPGGMALYIDGAAPITDPYTGGLGASSGGAGNFEPITFGAGTTDSDDFLVTPTTEFFAGFMEDVRINNRALTLAEVQALASCPPAFVNISGTVFEDVNYGGGPGRDLTTATADAGPFTPERDNVTVELYDAAGNYVSNTVTAVDGSYSFTSLVPAIYTVRVVNSTVTSTRAGSDGNELAVQTFRADGDGEAAGVGANKVGGEQPIDVDAPANGGAQTLAVLQSPAGQFTQSIVTIDASSRYTVGVDFGFNFSTVVNTEDADQGSLRQFILNANLLTDNAFLTQNGLTPAAETSIFMIPGAGDALGRPADPRQNFGGNAGGEFTIQAAGTLTTLIDPVIMDATTQTGFGGLPLIELDGTLTSSGVQGLLTDGSGHTIRGFVINRFGGDGIQLSGVGGNTIVGNYIGTDVTGTAARANGDNGIEVASGGNVIGGTVPADRNLISGNGARGIELPSGAADITLIQGNYIGTDITGLLPLGNTLHGIVFRTGTTGNMVGGTALGAGNVIAHNGNNGILAATGGSNGNSWLGNAIHSNTLLGIDLNDDGVTPNDPGDPDVGPNDLLNYPVITSVVEIAGTIYVYFDLDVPAADYRVEFFTNPSGADPSGNGEGEAFAGAVTVTHTGSGIESFWHSFPGALGDVITSTATEEFAGPVFGATSEFSAAVTSIDPCPGGAITTTADAGAVGSLRSCIRWANANPGDDTLAVPAGTYNLSIAGRGEDAAATGDLDVTDNLVINGADAGTTIIDGGGLDRVFAFSANGDSSLSNLTVRNGNPGGAVTEKGGGILNRNGTLTLADVMLTGNSVGGDGGGLDAGGSSTTIITNSTISGNTTTSSRGGGLRSQGTLSLTNVTFSGNAAVDGGGFNCHGPCTATNVTVTANSASTDGDGIRVSGPGTLSLKNSIVANNAAGQECSGPIISLGNNLSSDGTCSLTGPGDQPNTSPLLGPLQDNGGPTFTHALLTGSPAIDAGDSSVCIAPDNDSDQRGFPRPVGASCDIGAYEEQTVPLNLIKAAFWTDGTPIPNGATIPSGVEFKYLLYINNPGGARSDVTVRDVLDPAFQYQVGTIQVDNSLAECAVAVCTPAEEQAIFTAVDGAAFLTDAADGDVASYTGASSSVDAGNGNVGNLQLDINGSAVWAILFSAKMP